MNEHQNEPAPTAGWGALAVLASALAMIVLDGTIVAVALPAIIGDLTLQLTDAQWITSLYSVVFAALLLTSGRLGDRFGRRHLLVAGVTIFTLASITAALAGDISMLLWSRLAQGIGGALVLPATLSTVNATFRGPRRATAFGIWGAVMSGAAALGPLLGGALTTWLSWRWVFYVNIPIGVAVVIATLALVPETRGRREGLDLIGVLLSATGFGLLVFGFIEATDLGWWAPRHDFSLGPLTWPTGLGISAAAAALVLAAVVLAVFIGWKRHRTRSDRPALLDLSLFRAARFSWGNVTAGVISVGEFALIFVLPLYLVNALGLDILRAGWILAAMAAGSFLAGGSARHLATHLGPPRVVILGLALEIMGVTGVLLAVTQLHAVWGVVVGLVIYGLGLGLASAQLTSTLLVDVPTDRSGTASATQSTSRQLGAALGTAVSGSALAAALPAP